METEEKFRKIIEYEFKHKPRGLVNRMILHSMFSKKPFNYWQVEYKKSPQPTSHTGGKE